MTRGNGGPANDRRGNGREKMTKPKQGRDLRFDPAPDDSTDEELEDRAMTLADAVLSGAGTKPRRRKPEAKS